jgi:hypothetical protein
MAQAPPPNRYTRGHRKTNEWIPLNEIIPFPDNPFGRTTPRALEGLRESMQVDGMLSLPHVLVVIDENGRRTNHAVDFHRRHLVLWNEFHATNPTIEIECRAHYTTMPQLELLRKLNKDTLDWKGEDWLESVVKENVANGPLESLAGWTTVPLKHRIKLLRCEIIWGAAGMRHYLVDLPRSLGLKTKAPTIASAVDRFDALVRDFYPRTTLTVRQIGIWVATNGRVQAKIASTCGRAPDGAEDSEAWGVWRRGVAVLMDCCRRNARPAADVWDFRSYRTP